MTSTDQNDMEAFDECDRWTSPPRSDMPQRGHLGVSTFKKYRRTKIAELRHFTPGETLSDRVSVSASDKEAGSPKPGDMIARNPASHDDQWLVAAAYAAENFATMDADRVRDDACKVLLDLAEECRANEKGFLSGALEIAAARCAAMSEAYEIAAAAILA